MNHVVGDVYRFDTTRLTGSFNDLSAVVEHRYDDPACTCWARATALGVRCFEVDGCALSVRRIAFGETFTLNEIDERTYRGHVTALLDNASGWVSLAPLKPTTHE